MSEHNVAYDLGAVNLGAAGDQRLYRLDPPATGYDWDDDSQPLHEFVVVSAALVMGVPETYIFPSNEKGEITRWLELPGSLRNTYDHGEALAEAGYKIIVSAEVTTP